MVPIPYSRSLVKHALRRKYIRNDKKTMRGQQFCMVCNLFLKPQGWIHCILSRTGTIIFLGKIKFPYTDYLRYSFMLKLRGGKVFCD